MRNVETKIMEEKHDFMKSSNQSDLSKYCTNDPIFEKMSLDLACENHLLFLFNLCF